jgi:protease secretion system membrane fusion protein
VHLIDKVRVGLPVEILFPAFNQRTTPNIPGEVMIVPNNSTVDQKKGDSFYKVQVRVTERGDRLLAQNKIRPGMMAEVFIVTGERSLMSYLLKPLLDRTQRALREE